MKVGTSSRRRIVTTPPFTLGGKKSYDISFINDTLKVLSTGYTVIIYVPKNLVREIKGSLGSGGLTVDISSNSLRSIDFMVKSGGAKLGLSDLVNTSVKINVLSGGLKAELSLLGNVKNSVSRIDVSVSGGGAKLEVKAPSHKLKFSGKCSGGGLTLRINGEKVAVGPLGSRYYEDPNYESSPRKLIINVDVSGGGADIWVMR